MAANVGLAFLPYYRDLMEILETNDEMRKASRGISKQAMWAGVPSFVGGIVLGVTGAFAFGIVGCFIGYMLSEDYSSMLKVLRDLNDGEKQNLVYKIQRLVGSAALEALRNFIGRPGQRKKLLNLIKEFVNNMG